MNIFHKYTLRTLSANRTRTLVTIVGIVLSVSMFTAVTTFASSLIAYLVNGEIAQMGNWHGSAEAASAAQIESARADARVEDVAVLQNLGYARLDAGADKSMPYLFLGGMNDAFQNNMPITLTQGRMPEAENEALLPDHLYMSGRVQYALGDVLALEIGERRAPEAQSALGQTDAYGAFPGETLETRETVSFTVVGFYKRLNIEHYRAPGYTVLTPARAEGDYTSTAYVRLKSAGDIYEYMPRAFEGRFTQYNQSLLRYMGASDQSSFNAVLYRLAGILIAIIMLASIALIYNAFSISLSERTKQFGLLSSVGATKRQLLRGVLFEALVLCGAGIPLGVLAGIAGIGVTLKVTAKMLSEMITGGGESYANFGLCVSAPAILVAGCVGLFTVLISAWIPARRALRVSAIDAIRQTADIGIKPGKVRTGRLTYWLFGFPGMIAAKNFKRNRRKYRSTVLSLFVSVVLFISASSFCAYLTSSTEGVLDNPSYNLSYFADIDDLNTARDVFARLSSAEGVTGASMLTEVYCRARVPAECVNQEYALAYGDQEPIGATCIYLDDDSYLAWLQNSEIDPASLNTNGQTAAVALDMLSKYDGERYHVYHALACEAMDFTAIKRAQLDRRYFAGEETDEDGQTVYLYQSDANENDVLRVPEREAVAEMPSRIGAVVNRAPMGVDAYWGDSLLLVYPLSAMPEDRAEFASDRARMFFSTPSADAVEARMADMLAGMKASVSDTASGYLYNHDARMNNQKSLIRVIRIFSYGFILLISLISAANVFNTISTNIHLRKREFAILRSTGMTKGGLRRMMNFECLMYGAKGLLYGLPVSVLITYLIYQSVLQGVEIAFYMPMGSVAIAVVSVFAVVFATMLYSMKRIQAENTVDALKNENL